jgi:hypothetical protein
MGTSIPPCHGVLLYTVGGRVSLFFFFFFFFKGTKGTDRSETRVATGLGPVPVASPSGTRQVPTRPSRVPSSHTLHIYCVYKDINIQLLNTPSVPATRGTDGLRRVPTGTRL